MSNLIQDDRQDRRLVHAAWSLMLITAMDRVFPPRHANEIEFSPVAQAREYLLDQRWLAAIALLDACRVGAFEEPLLADKVDAAQIIAGLLAEVTLIESTPANKLMSHKKASMRLAKLAGPVESSLEVPVSVRLWISTLLSLIFGVSAAMGQYPSFGRWIARGHPEIRLLAEVFLPFTAGSFLLCFVVFCSVVGRRHAPTCAMHGDLDGSVRPG